jgi:hypothetical protein
MLAAQQAENAAKALLPKRGRSFASAASSTWKASTRPAVPERTIPMPSLRKIPWTKPLPPGAELFTKKSKRYARWTDG